MAQAATNPKIEELRFRIKSDAKSRLFYPLAEELRKISQLDEAESVLRTGLTNHPTYLSAWVSLGRVLRDRKKNNEAVEALNKALQLDPGNVVAARILADAYLELGEKVEAIKKYKLVYALLPADEALEATIAKLDAEINAPAVPPDPVVEAPVAPAPQEPEAIGDSTEVRVAKAFVLPQFDTPPPPPRPAPDARVFDDTATGLRRQQNLEFENDDAHLAASKTSDSPFAEPGVYEGYGTDAFSVEHRSGMPVEGAPPTSELPMPRPYEPLPVQPEPEPEEPAASADEADVFEPAGGIAPGIVTEGYGVVSSMPPIDEADFTRTLRMAELYAAEGSFAEARDIYEDLLARDPSNRMIREKLDALPAAGTPQEAGEIAGPPRAGTPFTGAPSAKEPPPSQPGASRNPKIERLESWLARVKRGEVGRV